VTDSTTRYRKAIYIALNVIVALALCVGSGSQSGLGGEIVYVVILFAVCSAPLLVLDGLNGRYALLGMFMLTYFTFFGALDLSLLASGTAIAPDSAAALSAGEWAILLTAVLIWSGYLMGLRMAARPPDQRGHAGRSVHADWSANAVLIVGLALWLAGMLAVLYFQVYVMPEKSQASAQKGFGAMGPLLTFIVMSGHMVEPLGVLILAYGYARFRTMIFTAIIIPVVLAQVAAGFVTDIKSFAFLGGVLVILTTTLIHNKIPKVWVAAALVFMVVSFPLFQAYRMEVTGERGLNRWQAAQNIDKVISIVLSSSDKASENGTHVQGFFERSSSKSNVELTLEKIGTEVPFLDGASLVALPLAFVPRLLWPDKPDVSPTLLFDKEVLHGSGDTHISLSQIAELYWNYGWPGILGGALLTGLILGAIAARFNLAAGVSVTRLLVLLVTVQTLCFGFGGGIAVTYVVWLRGLGAIAILHLLFARRTVRAGQSAVLQRAAGGRPAASEAPRVTPAARFPNLMH
jgi:hypothetical protein